VADRALGEQLAQAAVAGVAPGAVGHQPPGDDAAVGEPGQRAFGERGHGGGLLVCEQLAVGQAAVVVDDRVKGVVTERVALLGTGLAAVAGDGVPGAPEARVALDIHVQQITRARPLVAHERRARTARRARAAVPLENRVHRRMRDPGLAGDQPWPPARALARGHYLLLNARRRAPRRTMWTARAIRGP
jgi:hypothetical protein